MIMATDWTGIAAAITALFGGIAAVIGAVYAAKANGKVSTPDGTPSLGELGVNVAAAVTTPPDHPPLGEVAAKASETLDHVHEVVCNEKDKSEPAP